MDLNLFIQVFINGLLLGGIYISIGIGFALVFGVLEIIDFAIGEYVMLGAFFGSVLAFAIGTDVVYLIPLVFVVFFVVGFVVQPLLHHVTTSDVHMPILMALAFTYGIALFAQGGMLTIYGPGERRVPTEIATGGVEVPGVGIFPTSRLMAGIFGIVAVLVLLYYLYYTDDGMAIRAIAEDRTLAQLMGINVKKYQSIAYGTYAGLTAVAGIFIGITFSVNAEMGLQYTMFAFFMVVLAGMGYLHGIILAGFILGVMQVMISTYVSGRHVFLLLFFFIYLVLVVSPQGIFGKGEVPT